MAQPRSRSSSARSQKRKSFPNQSPGTARRQQDIRIVHERESEIEFLLGTTFKLLTAV